ERCVHIAEVAGSNPAQPTGQYRGVVNMRRAGVLLRPPTVRVALDRRMFYRDRRRRERRDSRPQLWSEHELHAAPVEANLAREGLNERAPWIDAVEKQELSEDRGRDVVSAPAHTRNRGARRS